MTSLGKQAEHCPAPSCATSGSSDYQAMVGPLLPAGLTMIDCPGSRTYKDRQFKKRFGRGLNLSSPQTLNEKIHWLMRYYRRPIMTSLADEYEVRDYVARTIGHEFLNELYGVWNDNYCDSIRNASGGVRA
ncbi:MAG: hypothetical protein QM706_05935 [Nitrospira sp.]